MLTAHHYNNQQPGMFAVMAQQANAKVRHLEANAPLLQQWEQLIEAICEDANTRQWVTLVNPPFIPNDRYLRQIGLANHYIRVVRLHQQSKDTENYIRQCVQNGKSSLVAIWADACLNLPEELQDEQRVSCRTLVFSGGTDCQSFGDQLELSI